MQLQEHDLIIDFMVLKPGLTLDGDEVPPPGLDWSTAWNPYAEQIMIGVSTESVVFAETRFMPIGLRVVSSVRRQLGDAFRRAFICRQGKYPIEIYL